MSLACKCDRCGKLYERYRGTGYGDANGFQFCRMDIRGSIDARNAERDLCPECMEELKKWFKNEPFTNKSRSYLIEKPMPRTYNDIYKEFLSTKWGNDESTILDWRPAEDLCTIRIWTSAGPIYIYDSLTEKLTLEVQHAANKTV